MSALHFEWDERKAAANVKKHGVSFEEANPPSTMNTRRSLTTPIIPKTKSVSFCPG